MPQASLDSMRIVNPILTNVAHGVRQHGFVGQLAFPPTFVDKRKGKIIRFNEDEFYLHEMRRAPGSKILSVSGGYGSDDYELYQDAIEEVLPYEHLEESSGLPFSEQSRRVKMAMRRVGLRLEYDQLSLLGNLAQYPAANRLILAGSSQFSDPTSNIEGTFDTAIEAVENACGALPNTIIFGGRKVFNASKRHPRIRDQYKYVSEKSIDIDMVLKVLGFSRGAIALAKYKDPLNPALGKQPILSNKIWIGYVPDEAAANLYNNTQPSASSDLDQPSFGYTYTLKGGVVAKSPRWSEEDLSWHFPVLADRAPVLTGLGAGFLMDNVTA
jgi:hypothetical protein